MPRIAEGKAVTAVAVGVTVFAASRSGVLARIPAVGPISAPIATIIIGAILATLLGKAGMTGEILEGAGYGLIAAGVLELSAGR